MKKLSARSDLVQLWLQDWIVQEMRQLRPSFELRGISQAQNFALDQRLDHVESDIDSLELVDLASHLYLALDAESSGAISQHRLGRSFGAWSEFSACAFELASGLGFFSSGTSGERKLCQHTWQELDGEITELIARFPQLGATRRTICTVPSNHIYGFLFAIMLPTALGVPCVRLHNPTSQEVRTHAEAGDLIIATPRLIARLLSDKVPVANSISLVSAGAKLSDTSFSSAKALGYQMLLDVYGSSETGGLGTRADSGSFLTLARAFEKARIQNAPDDLRWLDAQRFSIAERLDRQVQIAGTKVSLEQVELLLVQIPAVKRAEVYLRGKGHEARLAATITLRTTLSKTALRAQIAERLSSVQTPQEIEMIFEL